MTTKEEVVTIENVVHDKRENDDIIVFNGSDALLEAAEKAPHKPFSWRMIQLYLICIVPFMCSTVNGYDGTLLSSLLLLKPFNDQFGATTVGIKAGIISAMYQIGSVCAIPFIGPLTDITGRRFAMWFGSLVVILGAIVEATSKDVGQFLGGRFLLGWGVAFSAAAAPMFVVEISHPLSRGALTGSYNCLYSWGSIIATVVLFCTQAIPDNRAWIIPTYIQILCPGIVVIFAYFIPESPRWLYTHGKQQEAKDILTKYHGEGDSNNPFVILQITEFELQLELDGSDKRWWDYRAFFNTKANIYRLACNLVYGSFGQLSNGGISYFQGAFYHSAGVESNKVIFGYNLGLSFQCFVVGLIGAHIIEYFGRRKVIISSMFGMAFFWAWVTVCVARFDATGQTSGGWARGGIAGYFLFFVVYATGVTPMQGLYPVEVLSYEQRGKGMALSALVTNAVGLINQFATPVALQKIGWKTYLVWTIWCIAEGIISYFLFVETKGFTLEELDEIFEAKSPRLASVRKRVAAVDESHNIIEITKEEP